jgi:hypothetical protein
MLAVTSTAFTSHSSSESNENNANKNPTRNWSQ